MSANGQSARRDGYDSELFSADADGPIIFFRSVIGNPERLRHAESIVRPSPLAVVADAVVEYTRRNGRPVYVERRPAGYRWAPAGKGGPYPLLREMAKFLECSHLELTVGCIATRGWSVIGTSEAPRTRKSAILENAAGDPDTVAEAIRTACGGRP